MIGILAIGQIRNILMDQGPLCIIDGEVKRIFMDNDLQVPSLNDRLLIPVCQLCRGCFHTLSLAPQHRIRP